MILKSNIAPVHLQKAFGIVLVLFFSLSLFATGALSGGCFDGTGCLHCNLQGQLPFAGAGTAPMSHGCPNGSCDFENSTTPGGFANTMAAISVDNPNVAGYALGAADEFSSTRNASRFIPLPAFTEPIPTPPVYLLNRSLLC